MKAIKITLDKERTLRYNLNSLRRLEKEFNITLSELGNSTSMEVIQAFLYVGLVHEDDTLTFERVGDLVTLDKLVHVNECIALAFQGNPA